MKNFKLPVIAMAIFMVFTVTLSFMSCNDEDDPSEVKFSVSKDSYVFQAEGGSSIFDVTLENGQGKWSAVTASDWLTLEYDGNASGTLTVTAENNPMDDFRRATVTLSTEGHENLVIEIKQEGLIPSVVFSVSKDHLPFTAEGGTNVLDVILENGHGPWSANSTADWLTLEYDGSESGTLTVTVGESSLYETRTTSITLSTEGHEDITVTIEQEGLLPGGEAEHIAERSSWWRMNVKDHVKTMSSHYDYFAGNSYFQDLEFNKYGMLEKFTYAYPQFPEYSDDIFIEYDSENHTRITKITGSSIIVGGDPFMIIFHYGNHGKYITTYDVFGTIDNQGVYTYWRAWMPALIKDLETIEFVGHANPSLNGLKFVYSFDGNSGSSNTIVTYEGEIYDDPFHSMTYEGAYPKSVTYPYAMMGSALPFTSDYDINPVNGYYKTFDWFYTIAGLGSESWSIRTYNDDANNSIATFMDFSFNSFSPETCIYDSNMNLTQLGDLLNAIYTYDERGNWTKAVVDCNYQVTTYENVIEYFD